MSPKKPKKSNVEPTTLKVPSNDNRKLSEEIPGYRPGVSAVAQCHHGRQAISGHGICACKWLELN